ncbi:MAG: 3-dehydroquinate synthase [Ignavibacterium sp.]|nr:3-dehydroquinate synthase [Ignavibacterium sp.]
MKINVKHSHGSYSVFVFEDQLAQHLKKSKLLKTKNLFVVIDSNVYKLHWKKLYEDLNRESSILNVYKFSAKEKNKSHTELIKILKSMFDNRCRRDTLLVSIGGGITGDISAMAASIFMRGIDYINIPTTLLSIVDSSVGGKTGINFNSGKNLVGTFYQPKAVFTDISFLYTLPERELQSGLGEVIKYSFIAPEKEKTFFHRSFNIIINKNYNNFIKIISKCVKIKSALVENDEREVTGSRKVLNFGHTFAHGIESASDHKIKHGEAVVFGIITSLFYSYREKLITAEYLFENLLDIQPAVVPFKKYYKLINPEIVFKSMLGDKKNNSSGISLVLINQSNEILVNYSGNKNGIIKSLIDMKVWVKESSGMFKKETVEK